MKQVAHIFKNLSALLITITLKLEKLSQQKSMFAQQINFQANKLHQSIKEKLLASQININKFSNLFSIDQQKLYDTLFNQNNKKISRLSCQKLCTFLKINKQKLNKNHSSQQVVQQKVMKFVQNLKTQINVLYELREVFSQNTQHLERIFEQIDFFNNKYIDCASLIQFFNHYSSGDEYSQIGSILLLQMIKGYHFGAQKIFYEDLQQFVLNKQLQEQEQIVKLDNVTNTYSNPSHMRLLSAISGNSLQKNLVSGHIIKNDSALNLKTLSNRSNINTRGESYLNQQFLSPDRSESVQDSGYNIIDLSLSPSISPKSQMRKKDFLIQGSLNKNCKNPTIKTSIFFKTTEFNKQLDCQSQHNQKQKNIKIQHDYKIEQQRNKNCQNMKGEQNSQRVQRYIQNQQQQSKQSQQNNAAFALPDSTNKFQISLIKSHTRNSAYLNKVKLMGDPKSLIQDNTPQNQQFKINALYRPCLSNKLSIFQQKKIQFIFSMQYLGQQYSRWYKAVQSLIQQNQKFTFINAFSVIDTEEKNSVKLKDFKQFLKDCEIQKKNLKILSFFDRFSAPKNTQLTGNVINKQNIGFQLRIEVLGDCKIMRFSDFLKIFYVNKAVPLILKCKKRNVQIYHKWDDKMRNDYCNLFRIVMDSTFQIDRININLAKIYVELSQIWKFQTFQRVFGREIMRFDQMQKILGKNCLTLLSQISKEDQCVDEEQLAKYLRIKSNKEK